MGVEQINSQGGEVELFKNKMDGLSDDDCCKEIKKEFNDLKNGVNEVGNGGIDTKLSILEEKLAAVFDPEKKPNFANAILDGLSEIDKQLNINGQVNNVNVCDGFLMKLNDRLKNSEEKGKYFDFINSNKNNINVGTRTVFVNVLSERYRNSGRVNLILPVNDMTEDQIKGMLSEKGEMKGLVNLLSPEGGYYKKIKDGLFDGVKKFLESSPNKYEKQVVGEKYVEKFLDPETDKDKIDVINKILKPNEASNNSVVDVNEQDPDEILENFRTDDGAEVDKDPPKDPRNNTPNMPGEF